MARLAQMEDGTYYLADDWHIDDVLMVRPDLTEEQAVEVLGAVADNFDAGLGITWFNFEFWADELFPPAEEDQQDEY
jgi:hypothetical protein